MQGKNKLPRFGDYVVRKKEEIEQSVCKPM